MKAVTKEEFRTLEATKYKNILGNKLIKKKSNNKTKTITKK